MYERIDGGHPDGYTRIDMGHPNDYVSAWDFDGVDWHATPPTTTQSRLTPTTAVQQAGDTSPGLTTWSPSLWLVPSSVC